MIVAFGDSYTEGYGARSGESYPARLAASIGRPVLNRGVSGETAAEAIARIDRDVIAHDPEIAIVEFGVNEAYRSVAIDRALRDQDAILSRIRASTRARIVLVGVRFWSYQEEFEAGLRAIAEDHGAAFVPDVVGGIVSRRRDRDDGDARLRSDAFHPNAAGYALVAERIRRTVHEALASSSARSQSTAGA